MQLADIRAQLGQRDDFAAAVEGAASGQVGDVRLRNAARPVLLAALAERIGRPLILVVPDEARAGELVRDVQAWAADIEVMPLPDPDQPAYSQMAVNQAILNQRVAVLSRLASIEPGGERGRRLVVVASVPALLRRLVPPAEFRKQFLTLAAGVEVTPETLVARLAGLGYRRNPLVEAEGEFAGRGGIVDFFPPGARQPLRVDFFGDEIESLRYFDAASQRSGEACPEILLSSASEVPVWLGRQVAGSLKALDLYGLRPEDRETWVRHLDNLENNIYFDGAAFYTMSTMEGAVTLLDYCPQALVALDEPDGVRWAVAENERLAAESRDRLVAAGELPAEIGSPVFGAGDLANALERAELRITHVDGPPGSGKSGKVARVGGFAPAKPYAGRLTVLISDLEEARAARTTTILASYQGKRFCDLLNERGLGAVMLEDVDELPNGAIAVSRSALAEGWVLAEPNIQCLTDTEIFGRSRVRPRRRQKHVQDRTFLSDLKPGDYVVHIDHGIGQFKGIVKASEIGGEREYLLLRYAKDDKLYVPIDQLGRVQRYVAMGDFSPRLSRLGSGDWEKAKQKARGSARDIAEDLLEIYAAREVAPGHSFAPDAPWQTEMEDKFPYIETPDQVQAFHDVKGDMESERPMDRLVCGDVGYGKTEVAIRAAFKAVMDGRQVAVLVPTTILAQQHLDTFRERMEDFPVKVDMLSRFRSPAEQAAVVKRVAAGDVDIVIGTHRLIQKDIEFANLGLVVIDEEQRFGVADKERLKRIRKEVDVLTLTATPIPRTLHMALVGVRGISVMESPPADRQAVKTYVTGFDDQIVRRAILAEIDRGGQVYFVHNRIKTIDALAARMRELVPEARFTVAHGQMPSSRLERVMVDFAAGEAEVLVCTAIIENGMDLPNVNTLIADECWMFGLSQLYQLRGRVGRSINRAYAYFLYSPERRLTEEAQKRLQAILEASELGAGFRLAMRDLEIRGAGDLLGADQHGFANAVGFDLYCRMLADAVKERKGEAPEGDLVNVAQVGLPLDAYLPDDYMTGYETKIREYQRLARAVTVNEAESAIAGLRDRFGEFPEPVSNLAYVVRLRAKATTLGIESITSYGGELLIRLPADFTLRRRTILETVGPAMRTGRTGLSWSNFQNYRDWQARIGSLLDAMAEHAARSITATAAAGND